MLVNLAVRKAGASAVLEVASDGEKAIAALEKSRQAPPACVLLDNHLPNISGLEVLAWIRSQPAFKRLPVVMLTSSELPSDINRAYDLGANSYFVKPRELNSLVALARAIKLYWLQTNTQPACTG